MLSNQVREQEDYRWTMKLIQDMLDKAEPELCPGSIKIGKQIAKKYKDAIEAMLLEEYANQTILRAMHEAVSNDLSWIRADCEKRMYSQHVKDNDALMSMILDFVDTLYDER